MKAAVLYEIGQPMVVEGVELDEPKAGEVKVRVQAAGICRSDLHFMKGEQLLPLPAVLGHEGAGIVEQVGMGITNLQPGDHVIFSFVPYCGRCAYCLNGRSNLCDAHYSTGAMLFDGTTRLHRGNQRIAHMGKVACFAEQNVVPETGCVLIPSDLPWPQAAFIGCCVTTGVGAAVFAAGVRPGSSVAVFGCGGVGLNILQGARLRGASTIIAVDLDEGRLSFSRGFGATDVVNAAGEDPILAVQQLTGGRGADYTFEAFGSAETVRQAYKAARKGGTIVVAGLAPIGDQAGIDASELVRQEKTLKGTYYGSTRPAVDMLTMVDLYLSGQIEIDGLVGKKYALDEINEAFRDLERASLGRGVITTF
ncbi:MAG: zinc-binding dehydrogenase [Dehalococcoidia bacterium]|nr:zinc-binding dehydrogenase [Dehalococcoidia bacterium]